MTIPGNISLNIAYSFAHAKLNSWSGHSDRMSANVSNTLEILGAKRDGSDNISIISLSRQNGSIF